MNDLSPNDLININPYNAGAFGALVALLLFIALYFKKLAEQKEEHIKEIINKTHEIQEAVNLKLNEISLHSQNKDERIVDLLKDIKSKLDTIR
jgi:hypothetical protein